MRRLFPNLSTAEDLDSHWLLALAQLLAGETALEMNKQDLAQEHFSRCGKAMQILGPFMIQRLNGQYPGSFKSLQKYIIEAQ